MRRAGLAVAVALVLATGAAGAFALAGSGEDRPPATTRTQPSTAGENQGPRGKELPPRASPEMIECMREGVTMPEDGEPPREGMDPGNVQGAIAECLKHLRPGGAERDR